MFGSIKQSVLYQELSLRLVFIGCFVSLGAMGFGFDNSWWGGALGLSPFGKEYGAWDEVQNDWIIPSEKQSAGTGTGSAGIIVGCLVAPWLCSNLGRRPTLLVMASFLTVGIILEATAMTSFWQLVVGRIVVYSGIGLASNVVPMYQSECAPAKVRGVLRIFIGSLGLEILMQYRCIPDCILVLEHFRCFPGHAGRISVSEHDKPMGLSVRTSPLYLSIYYSNIILVL